MLQNRSVCHCRNTLISFPVNELGGIFIFLHRKCDILPPQAGQVTWHSTRARKQVPLPVVQPQTKQNQISITMKKTFITLLALAGIAMGEMVNVQTVIYDTNKNVTLTNVFIDEDTEGWVSTGWNSLSSANIKTDLDLLGVTEKTSGHYYYIGTGLTDANSQYKTGTVENHGITITGRGYGAQKDGFYVNVTSVSDILGGYDFENVTAITLTNTGKVSDSADAWYGLYTLNSDGTWSQIQGVRAGDLRKSSNGGSNDYSKTITLTTDQIKNLGENGKLFTLYRIAYSATQYVSMGSLTYDVAVNVPATPGVPEPATATLSLLALAGLAARRRRA